MALTDERVSNREYKLQPVATTLALYSALISVLLFSLKPMLNKKSLFIVVIIVIGMGCSSVTSIVTTDRLRNFPAEIGVGDIVHVATGEKMTFLQLVDSLNGARIVYVGEVHSNMESHEVQMQILKEFYERYGDNIAVGLEMFKRPHQDVLDKWTSGEISEEDLLSSTDWWHEWGFSYDLYKEIMDYARDNKIPLVALNVTKEIQKKISKSGLEGLSKEEKDDLPEIDTDDFYHKRYLGKYFHGHGDMDDAFKHFYEVQCVWEDVMAESISKYLSSPQGMEKKLLVFIGNGHIIYHFGVPKRVFRRNHLPYYTIHSYELRDIGPDDEHPLFAEDIPLQPSDFVRVIPVQMEESKVALGVMIRSSQEEKGEEKDKVVIESVLKDSPAGKAGLQAGDIVLSMDGESVSKVYDVIGHVRKKKLGDTCQIRILREDKEMTVKATFFEIKGHGSK